MHIKKATLSFLKDLKENNDRDWFQANKPRYEAARENVAEWTQALMNKLSESDDIETLSGKKALFRIYRDVRFSKNKSPYKTNIAGHLTRASKLRRGGYYFSIVPGGETVIGGGFYGIERDDLKRIREELSADGDPMREIMSDTKFVDQFGEMLGEQLKTAPKGYDREHPNIDLLRYKQFYAFRSFTDQEVTSEAFLDEAHEAMLALRPFFDYFSEVLTTNANGEIIV
ncbi:MAG: DUF2461 domain-containing protein [Bacteroidota bacterium]